MLGTNSSCCLHALFVHSKEYRERTGLGFFPTSKKNWKFLQKNIFYSIVFFRIPEFKGSNISIDNSIEFV